jgi:hypothetical protein
MRSRSTRRETYFAGCTDAAVSNITSAYQRTYRGSNETFVGKVGLMASSFTPPTWAGVEATAQRVSRQTPAETWSSRGGRHGVDVIPGLSGRVGLSGSASRRSRCLRGEARRSGKHAVLQHIPGRNSDRPGHRCGPRLQRQCLCRRPNAVVRLPRPDSIPVATERVAPTPF